MTICYFLLVTFQSTFKVRNVPDHQRFTRILAQEATRDYVCVSFASIRPVRIDLWTVTWVERKLKNQIYSNRLKESDRMSTMEPILSDPLLQFRPDTVRAVRALYGLDAPGRMEEAVTLLDDWVKKQPHFMMKDFSRRFLESTIVACKGSVEKAKLRMDRYCTVRTLIPNFFDKFRLKEDLSHNQMLSMFHFVILPKLVGDYHRVVIIKFSNAPNITTATMSDCFVCATIFIEYIKMHDYFNGFIFILDFLDFNLTEILTKLNWMEINQWYSFLMNGYGYRILSIHLISSSKLVDVFAGLFKKALPAKLGDRFKFHQDRDNIHDVVPKEALPQDYGGDEIPVKELFDRWVSLLSSPAHVQHMDAMRAARTDELCRPPDAAEGGREQLAGTFRKLNVD